MNLSSDALFLSKTCHMYTDGTYQRNNPNWHLEESDWKAKRVIEVMERNQLTSASVCDVGCGAGEIVHLLADHFPADVTYTGYDISPQVADLCAQRTENNITFNTGDVFESPGTYDLIMALDVVEHVEDYIGFLMKLKTKARYKLLHIPLDLALQRLWREATLVDDIVTVGHLHFFTKTLALAQLKRAGYKIIESTYIAKRIDLRMGGKKARFLTFPRRMAFALNQDFAARFFGGWSLSVLAE